jgi:hypothetical protein
MNNLGRFDYVAYDAKSIEIQKKAKELVTALETFTFNIGGPGAPASTDVARARALAITNLEQVYMWIGKAIRDDQIFRNGSAQLQENRSNQ